MSAQIGELAVRLSEVAAIDLPTAKVLLAQSHNNFEAVQTALLLNLEANPEPSSFGIRQADQTDASQLLIEEQPVRNSGCLPVFCKQAYYWLPRSIRGVSEGGEQYIAAMERLGKSPICFQYGNFAEAVYKAGRHRKLLFVLVSDGSGQSESHYRLLMRQQAAIMLNLNYVCFGVLANTASYRQLEEIIQVRPASIIILVAEGRTLVELSRHQGRVDTYQDMVNFIRQGIQISRQRIYVPPSSYFQQQYLSSQRRVSYEQERKERERQEKEYQQELDRLKESELSETTRIQEADNQKKRRQARKLRLRQSFVTQPVQGQGLITVAFRMPTGRVIKKGFRKEEKVDRLFDFIQSLEEDYEGLDILRLHPSRSLRGAAGRIGDVLDDQYECLAVEGELIPDLS